MRRFLASIALIAFSVPLHAQTSNAATASEIKGHFIGESIAEFLRIEPEAQQEVDVCRKHPTRSSCDRLVAALDRGQRAEISTSDSMDFVLDGGRLVKLTLLLHDTTEEATVALTRRFGARLSATNLPNHNQAGAAWENHLVVWNTAEAYVTLYEDNNPSLQDHQPLLVVESQNEHIVEKAESDRNTHALASNNLPQ